MAAPCILALFYSGEPLFLCKHISCAVFRCNTGQKVFSFRFTLVGTRYTLYRACLRIFYECFYSMKDPVCQICLYTLHFDFIYKNVLQELFSGKKVHILPFLQWPKLSLQSSSFLLLKKGPESFTRVLISVPWSLICNYAHRLFSTYLSERSAQMRNRGDSWRAG